MIVLGIESSCDDTGAAVVSDQKEILGEALQSQEEHKQYGGVVPEIAARAHLAHIDEIVSLCLQRAHMELKDVDAIAASCGPGLIGGVVVGAMTAKALALALNKPFVAVNHLEGHALVPRLKAASASDSATNIDVGPSAAPIIAIEAASLSSNPKSDARLRVKKIPN